MAPDYATLDARLTRLERENRRLRRIASITLFAIAPLALMAQIIPVPPRSVEARRVSVTDSDDRTRATIEMVGNSPFLTFFDGRGKPRVKLGLDAKGAPTLTAILPSGREIELLSEYPKLRPLTTPDDEIPSRGREHD